MGYSMWTDYAGSMWRYTEWVKYGCKHWRVTAGSGGCDAADYRPLWDELHASELYNLTADPDETLNVADQPQVADERKALQSMLHAGWRAASPGGTSTEKVLV